MIGLFAQTQYKYIMNSKLDFFFNWKILVVLQRLYVYINSNLKEVDFNIWKYSYYCPFNVIYAKNIFTYTI